MLKSPALFVALEGFWPSANQYRLPVTIPSLLHRIIADHRAMGFGVVPVGSARWFGLTSERERLTLQTDVEVAISMKGGVPVRTVLLMEDAHDPKEIWEVARRFDLDLKVSILVTPGAHTGVFRTAGVTRIASEGDLTRALAFA